MVTGRVWYQRKQNQGTAKETIKGSALGVSSLLGRWMYQAFSDPQDTALSCVHMVHQAPFSVICPSLKATWEVMPASVAVSILFSRQFSFTG